MKSILLILLVSLACVCSAPAISSKAISNGKALPKNYVDDIIIAALEKVRDVIRNGIPAANVPSLDPFAIPHLQVDLETSSATVHLQVDDTLVLHLSEFIVESVVSNLLQFKMSMSLRQENFRIEGKYNLDGLLLSLFPLFGGGNYYVHVTNATIGGGAGLDLGAPGIKNLFLDFTFESIEVHFENLLGGGSMESMVETVVNQLGKKVVDTIWPLISGPLCDIIEQVVNEALSSSNP